MHLSPSSRENADSEASLVLATAGVLNDPREGMKGELVLEGYLVGSVFASLAQRWQRAGRWP